VIPFFAGPSSASVWNAKDTWTEAWEERYAQWIADEVDENLLVPVRLAVDCADLCYVVRAIFSRIHHLPFLASDLHGVKIGHYSNSWDEIAAANDWRNDKRFRAFLIQLISHVTTKSYPHDAYPVCLNAATVKPGLVVYENIIASHACFVGRVNPDQIIPVLFFESSVPPAVRFKLSTTTNVYIYSPGVPRKHSGIVRWNWPISDNGKWRYIPDERMPHYSLDIYDASFPYRTQLSKALNRVVKESVAGKKLTQEDSIQELVDYFRTEIQFRLHLVNQAETILRRHQPGYRSEQFDYNYSTDSRDERLRLLIRQIWAGLDEYEIPREAFFQALQSIPISLSPRLPATNLYYLFITVDQRWISSGAYASAEQRWGMRWDEKAGQWIFGDTHPEEKILSWYPLRQESKEATKELIDAN
jgi:hypothetical protein